MTRRRDDTETRRHIRLMASLLFLRVAASPRRRVGLSLPLSVQSGQIQIGYGRTAHLVLPSLSRFLLERGKNHSTGSGLEDAGNRGFNLLTEKPASILYHNHGTVI